MVLDVDIKIPLKNIKVSRVVFISGLLTFIYCLEFCIGLRTVYYTFKMWSDPLNLSKHSPTSWTLCLACLFTATVTSFTVNVLSALWEQKQLEEKGKEKSAIRFAFHIIIGGMIWRYVSLWCVKTKEFQKKNALLLTMTKFFFTQTFTIPMVIVHVSVMDHLEELLYDVCAIVCISVNLILTCTMFSWCSKEVEELKKWNCETIDLVPLIFQSAPTADTETSSKTTNTSTEKEKASKTEKKDKSCGNGFEEITIKSVVLLQSLGFSLGRLLALGILLKLAGIYAVSIMFLQLLISVIYLKFQVPILVSDSLSKWRQLSRLAFMSYILIFEWHLNRDPKTAYDFSSNMKHSILYYCIATIESVFYLVTWSVTTSFSLKSDLPIVGKQQNKFCRIILIIGSLALVFSLTLHIVLLFWRSRKFSNFLYSVKRRYETTKLRLSMYGRKEPDTENKKPKRQISHIDISSPIPIHKNNSESDQGKVDLEKRNSYRDLREPLDEEIEIYFRKCDSGSRSNSVDKTSNDNNQINMPEEATEKSSERITVKTLDKVLKHEINSIEQNATDKVEKQSSTVRTTNASIDVEDKCSPVDHPPENSLKSKVTSFSSSISEQWGKFSNLSQNFAGSVKGQIQKKKEQFQFFRSGSTDSKKTDLPVESKSSKSTSSDKISSSSDSKTPKEGIDTTEGYFIGDDRFYQSNSLESVETITSKRIKFTGETTLQLKPFEQETDDEILPPSDTVHSDGSAPCPCFICKTLGDGRFRRRRSSSVPPEDRKAKHDSEINQSMTRYMSNPNISQNRCELKTSDMMANRMQRISTPTKMTKSTFSISHLSTDNRIEHYV